MARLVRTWWGERFLDVLERAMDHGRLYRGRSYAGPGRLLEFNIKGGTVKARVRGNINPYFGVTKEPRYNVTVKLKRLSEKDWASVTGTISQNAAFLSQLLVNEMPSTIEDAFTAKGFDLLPRDPADLLSTCSCPDFASPCKHVAGVYFRIASMLDRDPLLLFQLRGMTFAALRDKLATSPVGQALIERMEAGAPRIEYRSHRYTAPRMEALDRPDLKSYWQGHGPLPEVEPVAKGMSTPAILIRKGGHLPQFWEQNGSFIDVMDTLYDHIIAKNKATL